MPDHGSELQPCMYGFAEGRLLKFLMIQWEIKRLVVEYTWRMRGTCRSLAEDVFKHDLAI
jgi:hypothetical protein